MNNLNDTLPDLMRRATEDLEPESTDLVERGMRRGAVLRRRRTALLSVSGAGAVLATAGIIVGGSALFAGAGGDAPVAGTTSPATPTASVKPTPIPAVTPQETLATLKKLVAPSGAKITRPEARGGAKDGFVTASVVLDDGKGLSLIDVLVERQPKTNCTDAPARSCTVRADGSVVVSLSESPEYSRDGNPGGVISNIVTIYRPDGVAVHLTNYNAPLEKNAGKSRPKPVYSAAALVQLADSKLWKAPPAGAGKVWPTK